MKVFLIFLIFYSSVTAEKPNLWLIDEILQPVDLQAYSIVKRDISSLRQLNPEGCTCSQRDGCIVNNVKVLNRDFKLNCDENYNDYVKYVEFESSVVNFLPNDLKKFKNLETIKIEELNLLEINQDDLKDFKNLKNLKLQGNKIQKLDENLFEFNTKLETLSFAQNEIKFIHPNLFSKLNHLIELELLDNDCMSCSGFDDEFVNFTKEVALKNCAIPYVTSIFIPELSFNILFLIFGSLTVIIIVAIAVCFGLRKWKMNKYNQEILCNSRYEKELTESDWNKTNESYYAIVNLGSDLKDTLERPGELEKSFKLLNSRKILTYGKNGFI